MEQQVPRSERRRIERRRTERRTRGWSPADGPDAAGSEVRRVPSWLATAAAWSWRLLVILAVTVALVMVVRRLSLVFLPIIVALVLSTLAVPPARRLQRRLPRAVAAGIVVVGGVGILVLAVAVLTPPFTTQVGELQPTLGLAFERIFAIVESTPLDYDRDDLADLLGQIGNQVAMHLGGGENGEVAEQVAAGALFVAEFVTGLVLAFVLLFFIVKDGEQITSWMLARTPPEYRDLARATGARAWMALSGFVRGTAFIATVDAVLIGAGLALLRVPLVLPLAVLVFLGAFVPVIGAFVSGLVAVLVAFAAGGPLTALAVLGLVLVVQQVEGQLLQPVLMRRAVALHPAVVLLAIVAGALLAGLTGALLAVPLSAVASAVSNELRLRHEAHDGEVTAGGGRPLGPEEVGHHPPPPTVLERRGWGD
jgi:putative heme transporter